uniref:Uncharacterized protein LOC100180197 n=1 Tax=Phallusia mammillata TaxID=59560 RepID=A0A6F9DHU4_9ASCI|nr:uncharacterized protein LOC100180197 [Phallusia mammillata]
MRPFRNLFYLGKYCNKLSVDIRMQSNFSKYRYFLPIQTRCADNDYYGHVNNSQYHFYCDTVVNTYLIWYCGLSTDRVNTTALAYMIQTQCIYKKPFIFPQVILAGLGVKKVGKSSVHYEVAFFEPKIDYNIAMEEKRHAESNNHDPLLILGIGSQGLLVTENKVDVLKDMERHYHTEPSVTGFPVHVFVDPKTQRPLKCLPNHLASGLDKVFMMDKASKL